MKLTKSSSGGCDEWLWVIVNAAAPVGLDPCRAAEIAKIRRLRPSQPGFAPMI
jgi:hypothetical protein